MSNLAALITGMASGYKNKKQDGTSLTGGDDFETEVAFHRQRIRAGNTPPFASSPAWEEAVKREGGGGLSTLIASIIDGFRRNRQGEAMQPRLNLQSGPNSIILGNESPDRPTLQEQLIQQGVGQVSDQMRSPLGNLVAPQEDNSWKTRPLPPNPYNTPGFWSNWKQPL